MIKTSTWRMGILLLGMMLTAALSAEAGYYRRQGEVVIEAGRGETSRNDGLIKILNYSSTHVTYRVEGTNGQKFQFAFKASWNIPPEIIFPNDQLLPVSATLECLEADQDQPTANARFPWGHIAANIVGMNFPSAGCGPAPQDLISRDLPANPGARLTLTNRKMRGRDLSGGEFRWHFGACGAYNVYFLYKRIDDAPTVPAPQAPRQPSAALAGPEMVVFKLEDTGAVHPNPSQRTIFTLIKPTVITRIWTYHYNGGRGVPAGTLGLQEMRSGRILGPWNAVGTKRGALKPSDDSWHQENDGPFWYWGVRTNLLAPPGTYEVIDSDPTTWSTNSASGDMGFCWVYGKIPPHETTDQSFSPGPFLLPKLSRLLARFLVDIDQSEAALVLFSHAASVEPRILPSPTNPGKGPGQRKKVSETENEAALRKQVIDPVKSPIGD